MIDTDKYEGHTEGEWHVDDDGVGLIIKWGGMPHDFVDMENKANAQLMADAPILLQALMDERAEVKRLRDELKFVVEMLEGKPSNMEWYECRNLILEQVVVDLDD